MSSVFLKKKITSSGETHLSMTGGKYKIKPAEVNELYEHLVEDFKNNKEYYLTEKITEPYVLFIDAEKQELDKNIDIDDIAKSYQTQILKYYDVEESQTEYHILYKTSGCRDRAHIHFPKMNIKTKAEAKFLREEVMKDNTLNIQDPKTLDGSAYNTGLRMLGSYKKKEAKHPDKDVSPYVVDGEVAVEYFEKFSIRLPKNAIVAEFKDKKLLKARKLPVIENDLATDECLISSTFDIIDELVSCLSADRVEDREKWINLGILLRCLSTKLNKDYFKLYLQLSKQSKKFDGELKLRQTWDGFESYNNYNINTLYFWANQDNSKKLKEIQDKSLSRNIMYSLSCSHLAVAKLMYYFLHNKYSVDKDLTWYKFNGITGIWKNCLHSKKEIYIEFVNIQKIIKNELFKGEFTPTQKDCIKSLISKLSNDGFTNAVITFMNRIFQDEYLEFDTNPYLLGFTNGVIDLKTGEFRVGRFDDYVSITTGYDYVKRDTTRIKEIMAQIHPKQNVRDCYLKTMSKSLDGAIKNIFVLCPGFQGANGKSFEAGLRHLALGGYSQRGATSIITGEREDSGSANSSVMSLRGKRNVYFCEPSAKKKVNVSTVKELSGGDEMTARDLYKSMATFTLIALLSIQLNKLPPLDDVDGGVRRRMLIFRFFSRFVDNPNPDKPNEYKLNPTYNDKKVQVELSKEYICLLIEYYLGPDFTIPDEVKAETDDYLNENDPIKEFCEEFIHKDEDAVLLKSELKIHYKASFAKNYSQRDFYNAIEIELGREFQRDGYNKETKEKYTGCIFGYRFGEIE